MADDTKQDTSGFGTLLLIAEVMLDPIITGGSKTFKIMTSHRFIKCVLMIIGTCDRRYCFRIFLARNLSRRISVPQL